MFVVELTLLMKPVVLLTENWTAALPPTGTPKVAPFVVAGVKLSVVAVTVRLTGAECELPPVPLAVPVTVIESVPKAMFGAVLTVSVTFTEWVPSSVTLVGLKVQSAPVGKPAVQVPGVEPPVGELSEFAKLMVWVEPFTGVRVKVADANCPAEMVLGERAVTESVKSLTVTAAGLEVEALSLASPS